MMIFRMTGLLWAICIITCVAPVFAQSFSDEISGTQTKEGFITLHVDDRDNRVLATLPNSDGKTLLSAIYTMRLTAGLGSNPVGLDRGWGDSGQVVHFKRYGDKVIVEAENLAYRASSDNPLEDRAVRESFARSFVASLPVKAEGAGGSVLVDMTDFLTRDGLGLVQHLKARGQGSFRVSKDRTFVDTENVFAFPDNVEVDVFITLSSNDPGREVSTTAANGHDASLIQHHSFVRLPEPGFVSLKSDPRMGAIEEIHYDYSAALDDTIVQRFARRYRLEKGPDGKVVKPIVFYIDSGAPEPIRSALIDGAKWWEEAFVAAGYPDGYRVELLPEDYHPLDVRYNVVQWVHRQTRGWSYGGGVSDPRTGEMLKGHVNLGSLRVRQDRMIFEGLAGTSKTGSGAADDPIELALARIRQLSAHEVGHSLGFAHNFAASAYDKGSVMDYPAPDVRVTDGQLDFSHTYGVGIGAWDKHAATLLYGDLSDAERQALIKKAQTDGLLYVADSDGRSLGTGHPKASVWDNGTDAVATLNEVMAVRKIALDGFDDTRLKDGQPRSDLLKVIVPIYLYHRYQTAAAAKLLGGMTFDYAVTGDDHPPAIMVSADDQKAALTAILKTIEPENLDLSDETLALLTPYLTSWSMADGDRELFRRSAYPAFDMIAAADSAAAMTFDALLDPTRANRMVEFERRTKRAQFGFGDMLSAINRKVLTLSKSPRYARLSEAVQSRYVYSLMDLIDANSSPAVKSEAVATLESLQSRLSGSNQPFNVYLSGKISNYLSRPVPATTVLVKEQAIPPGSPIGASSTQSADKMCWHCDTVLRAD